MYKRANNQKKEKSRAIANSTAQNTGRTAKITDKKMLPGFTNSRSNLINPVMAQLQQNYSSPVLQRAVSEERIRELIIQASNQVGWSNATYENVHPLFIGLLRAEANYEENDEEAAADIFTEYYEPSEGRTEQVEPEADPYSQIMVLEAGTSIDFPALTRVMDDVQIGVKVSSKEWRAMRAKLSSAIKIKNKSHSDHGSNFDDPQRPEQQIVDWANVISGELKEKLSGYFKEKYGIYL